MERLIVSDRDIMITFFSVSKQITPTSSEIRNTFRILRLGVQRKAEADGFYKYYEYERFINDLLRKQNRQSTIDDFFFLDTYVLFFVY